MSEQRPEWAIEFYVDAQGRSPVVELLASLPAQERAKVRNALRLLNEFGVLLQMPHARAMTGHPKLWELRAGAVRLFYFAQVGHRFVILHGFRKKSSRAPRHEIAVAERRMAEVVGREE
jgi:phage-related protein